MKPLIVLFCRLEVIKAEQLKIEEELQEQERLEQLAKEEKQRQARIAQVKEMSH